MKKKVLLSVLLLASCLSLGSCRIVGIKGDTGPSGAQGEKGNDGKDGKDGEDGESPTITISEDGYWVIDGVKSTTLAKGQKGEDGVSIQNIERKLQRPDPWTHIQSPILMDLHPHSK